MASLEAEVKASPTRKSSSKFRVPREWFVTTPDGQLYLSNRDVQVYDPVSNQWKDGPLMLKDSKEGASVYVGGRLYVLGGTDMDGHVTSVVQALSASY